MFVYALLLFCDCFVGNASIRDDISLCYIRHGQFCHCVYCINDLRCCFFQGCGKNMPSDQLHHQCFSRGIHPYCVSRPYSNPVQPKSTQFIIVMNIHARTSLWTYLFAQCKTQYCIKQSVVRMAIKIGVKL